MAKAAHTESIAQDNNPFFVHIAKHPGTYALLLDNPHNHRARVGRLGELQLRAGTYLYIGSAFGPGGIAARCHHHARTSPRPHWHIDYLRAGMTLKEIWFSHDPQPREHQWAALIARARHARQPYAGFGSSDCRCHSHLFFFPAPPSFASFRRRAYAGLQNQTPIAREILVRDKTTP